MWGRARTAAWRGRRQGGGACEGAAGEGGPGEAEGRATHGGRRVWGEGRRRVVDPWGEGVRRRSGRCKVKSREVKR
jgi:hypothetical protein